MHTAIYRQLPKVMDVVHTHSLHAIAFSVTGVEIPVICTEILQIGGPVPVAPYACSGTTDGGRVACEIFASRPSLSALLLRNHGVMAIGSDLDQAFRAAWNCEAGAQIFLSARQTGKEPVPLTTDQIAEIYRVYRMG